MKKVDLNIQELSIVKGILNNYPGTVIFGSRIKGTSRKFSDLDVCIKDPITDYEFVMLQETFSESDLPFKVDLVDYSKVDNDFKKIIDSEGINLWRLETETESIDC